MTERWQNQEEAFQFALERPSCMFDMEMGTGKTRTAIDVAFARLDVTKVLVVCPKAVISVWPKELAKHAGGRTYSCWTRDVKKTVAANSLSLDHFIGPRSKPGEVKFAIINYDTVWKSPIGDMILKCRFDMVILDESHRAKSAGSKVSKYLAMLGKRVKYKLCLSGTPMANSPLDVYGQFRFLDNTIFGTDHNRFLQEYAIMGGPEKRFVVGLKNQNKLSEKFRSITYSCKMADVANRLKLPESLPPVVLPITIPTKDMKTSKQLSKEFIAECGQGHVVVKNVLVKMLRLQQIAAGFCQVQDNPLEPMRIEELNTSKEDALVSILEDISPRLPVVVFCVFQHDLDVVHRSAEKAERGCDELSGRVNQLDKWQNSEGHVLAVQIQAGAEGVDMTKAHHAVYFSLPHSLAMYNQSKARLYRPGQSNPVSFIHLIAEGTVDEAMYASLERKKDVIEAVKDGSFDFGFMK